MFMLKIHECSYFLGRKYQIGIAADIMVMADQIEKRTFIETPFSPQIFYSYQQIFLSSIRINKFSYLLFSSTRALFVSAHVG